MHRMLPEGLSHPPVGQSRDLGDFTTTPRLLVLSAISICLGVVGGLLALALLRLISFFTNLFFFGRLSVRDASPVDADLGLLMIAIPALGALIIGFMARFGSERIRGHGIPEAIEAILLGGSKIQPRVAVLKPVSSAISIGSGGPFGAEGPIIMTAGAVGSLIAQFFHLTSAERKTLLVAGAAAGMSATFAAPIAALALAVELLLFELKPRSLVPVALASATAAFVRRPLLGDGPLFPTPMHSADIGLMVLLACVVAGIAAGALSSLLTSAVYLAEDTFARLPFHWMWWPAIGGVVVGIGGFIFPEALGVGYSVIEALLAGTATSTVIVGVLLVKSTIWTVSLGSGTSGGVLAPLLMMGGALGGLEAHAFPDMGPGFWPAIGMAAILGGTMRAPLTGIIFILELTHDVNLMLPLLIATAVAHGFTVLVMRRSILTEKISRRGYHVTREYSIDPLEILFVREMMRLEVVVLKAPMPINTLFDGLQLRSDRPGFGQGLYPVVEADDSMVGVVTRRQLVDLQQVEHPADRTLGDVCERDLVVVYPDEPVRYVLERMATTGLTRMPVVDPADRRRLVGLISISDVLRARQRSLDEERVRERVLSIRYPTIRNGTARVRP
ncbi:MAG: chloride channel protein [Thermomicrobiales bacterium]|jgi:H+/Cl- antiporter ClcA|nr:chloride channel protein [Thermomicrobiales bacterium]